MRRFENNSRWHDDRPDPYQSQFGAGILGSGPGELSLSNLQQDMLRGNSGENLINTLVARQEQMIAEQKLREQDRLFSGDQGRFGGFNDSNKFGNNLGTYGHESQRGLMDNFGHEQQRGLIDNFGHEQQRGLIDNFGQEPQRGLMDNFGQEPQRGMMDNFGQERGMQSGRGFGPDSGSTRGFGLDSGSNFARDRDVPPGLLGNLVPERERGLMDRGFDKGTGLGLLGNPPLFDPNNRNTSIPSIFDLQSGLKRGHDLDDGRGLRGMSPPKRRSRFDDLRPGLEGDHLDARFRDSRSDRDSYDPHFPTDDMQGNIGFDARSKAQQHLRNIERNVSALRVNDRRGPSRFSNANDTRSTNNFRGNQQSRGGGQQNRGTTQQNRAGGQQNRAGGQQNRTTGQQNRATGQQNRTTGQQNRTTGQQNQAQQNRSVQNRTGTQNRPNTTQNRSNTSVNKSTTPNKSNVVQSKSSPAQNRLNTSASSRPVVKDNRPTTSQPGKTAAPPAKTVTPPAKTATPPSKVTPVKTEVTKTPDVHEQQAKENMDMVAPDIVEETDAVGDYDPKIAVGQNLVVPVSGFFCKLCHKFYNNQATAKVAHCQTRPHYDKVKKYLENKRQRELSQALAAEFDTSKPATNGTK